MPGFTAVMYLVLRRTDQKMTEGVAEGQPNVRMPEDGKSPAATTQSAQRRFLHTSDVGPVLAANAAAWIGPLERI